MVGIEQILFFCGIWILMLPTSEGNVVYYQKGKLTRMVHTLSIFAGCDSLLIALNALCSFTNQVDIFLIVLYGMLLFLNVFFACRKIHVERRKFSKIIVGSSSIIGLLSLIIIFFNFNMISFSCVLLTAILMILSTSNEEISFAINGE